MSVFIAKHEPWPDPSRTDPAWVKDIPSQVEVEGVQWRALNQGVRLTVYADSRCLKVLKVPHTVDQAMERYQKLGALNTDRGIVASNLEEFHELGQALEQRIRQGRLPEALLADMEVQPDGAIYQNYVTTNASLWGSADPDQQKKLLDLQIDTMIEAIRYGVFDKRLAVIENYGIDSKKSAVILDYSSLTLNREEAEGLVATSFWKEKFSRSGVLGDELRDYYLEQLSLRLNSDVFEKLWEERVAEAA